MIFTKSFAKKMEKNFEKLSIEEMSLVSGGGLFDQSPCEWAAGALGGALGGVYGAAIGFAIGGPIGGGVGFLASAAIGTFYGNAFVYGLCS